MRDSSAAPTEDISARGDGRVERAPRPSGPRSVSVPRGQQPQQQGAGRPLPREALGNSRKKADVVSPRREGLRDLRGQASKVANPEQSASQAVAEAIGRNFTGRTGRPSGAEVQSPGNTSSAGSGVTANSATQRAPLRPSPQSAQAQRARNTPTNTPTQSQPYRGLNNTQPARTNSQSRGVPGKSASSRAASTDLEKRTGGSSARSVGGDRGGASGSAATSTAQRGGSSQIPMGLPPQRAGVAPGAPRQPPSSASQHRPTAMERDAPGRIRHESPGQSPMLQPRAGLTAPPRRANGISGPSTAGAGYASANPALRSPPSTHRSTPLDDEMHSAQRNPSGNTIAPASPQPRNAHRSLSPNASGASGTSNTSVVGTSATRPQQPLGVRRPSCVSHIPSTGASPIPQAARTLPGSHVNTAPQGFPSPGSYSRQLPR